MLLKTCMLLRHISGSFLKLLAKGKREKEKTPKGFTHDGRGAMTREDGRRRRAEVRRRALRHQHEAHADGEDAARRRRRRVLVSAARMCLQELLRERELRFELCGRGRAGLEGPAALDEALDMLVGLHVVVLDDGSGFVLSAMNDEDQGICEKYSLGMRDTRYGKGV